MARSWTHQAQVLHSKANCIEQEVHRAMVNDVCWVGFRVVNNLMDVND